MTLRGIATDLATNLAGESSLPPYYDTALLHWDTDHGIVEGDAGKVGSWTDRKAGVVVSQGTGSAQPTHAASDYFKGKIALTFTGTSTLQVANSAAMPALNAGDFTVIVAGRALSASDADFVHMTAALGSGAESIRCSWLSASNHIRTSLTEASGTTNSVGTTDGLPARGFEVMGFGHDEAGGLAVNYTRENGRTTHGNTRTPQDIDSIALGSSTYSSAQNSDIAEVIVYDHALSADEWTAVSAYLDGKYRPVELPLQQGASAWFDPTQGLTEATGVSAWLDRIGGYTVANGTGVEQPAIVPLSERTGHQMLSFDSGASQKLYSDEAALSAIFNGTHTVYNEAVVTDHTSERVPVGIGNTAISAAFGRMVWTIAGNTRYDYRDGTNTDVATNNASSRPLAANWAYGGADGSSVVARCSGQTEHSVSQTATSAYDRFIVGARTSGTGFANFMEGEIGHVVIYEKALTTAEYAAMQAWLEAKWTSIPVPVQVGALHSWIASSGITEATGVSAWLDRIGGLSMAQGTGSAQPAFVSGSPSYVDFDDSASQYLSVTTPAATQAFLDAQTYTMYAGLNTTAGLRTVICGADATTAAERSEHYASGAVAGMRTHDGATDAVATSANTNDIDAWSYGAASGLSSRAARFRGTAEGTEGTTILAVAHTTLSLGARVNSSVSQHMDGRMYLADIFGRELNAADHAAVQAYYDSIMGL